MWYWICPDLIWRWNSSLRAKTPGWAILLLVLRLPDFELELGPQGSSRLKLNWGGLPLGYWAGKCRLEQMWSRQLVYMLTPLPFQLCYTVWLSCIHPCLHVMMEFDRGSSSKRYSHMKLEDNVFLVLRTVIKIKFLCESEIKKKKSKYRKKSTAEEEKLMYH